MGRQILSRDNVVKHNLIEANRFAAYLASAPITLPKLNYINTACSEIPLKRQR